MYHQEARDILVNALDKVINKDGWDSSLFFRNTLKRLLELREYVITELSPPQEQILEDIAAMDGALKQEQGYKKVYIEIYQAQGDRLEGWINAVKKLGDYYVSRPAYQVEDHVRELITSKRSRNDAYVAVWIHQENILSMDKMRDRLGHELLSLREGSIKVENIIEFVHDKNRYRLIENKLILNS